ncbi:MAG TPA: carotenoid biosynthesis protein [Bacteroidales bacterium]|nr:carotenoid biosynthesis protein [Bacteroidales bacterium]
MNHKIKAVYAIAVLILFFAVGVAGLAIPATHSLFVRLTPLSLLLSLTVLLLFHPAWSTRLAIYFLIIFTAGLLVEAIGVNTGVIFGEYAYGSVLGLTIWGTPLMIGVNWLMLIYTTWDMTGRIRMPVFLRIPASAILMVTLDFVMEPVAIKMGMWTWSGHVIPLQNYLAWFVISLLFFALASIMKIELRNKMSIPIWLILFTFFILLQLFNI